MEKLVAIIDDFIKKWGEIKDKETQSVWMHEGAIQAANLIKREIGQIMQPPQEQPAPTVEEPKAE